jgi:RpiR family carbohydrate utilization transcriptional regulator
MVVTTPTDRAGCLLRLQSKRESLRPAERTVADFVLAEPERLLHMTVSQTARDCNVGEATVIRLCRALGYSGYQEFKLRLAQDLVEPVEYIHEHITFADSAAEIAQKVFQTNAKAVENTHKTLDPAVVEAAARILVGAARIDIYGVGYSSFSALDAKYKFVRLGLTADAPGDPHLQIMAAVRLRPGDAAIGISHSGSTKDVVESLGQARKAGAATIAITNFSPSPLTREADLVLLTASPGSPLGGEVFTSRIAQLCVLDVLSVAVALTLGESCLDLIEKTSQAVKRKRY